MKYFSVLENIVVKKSFAILTILFLLAFIEKSVGKNESCTASGYQIDSGVAHATNKLLSGQYDEFIIFIGGSILVSQEKKREIIGPLEKYYPDGFANCRFIGAKNNSSEISSYLVEFEANGESVFFYAVALKEENGFQNGIMRFHISTDFSEMFVLWK